VISLAALSPDELKAICEAGESAAREYVLSRVDKRLVKELNISIATEKRNGTTFSADISIDLEPVVDMDPEELADLAAQAALDAIDDKMRGRKFG
jgi:hypothetical protein